MNDHVIQGAAELAPALPAAHPRVGFLLYDNRSGSTLLSALLNRFRGISVSHENDYVPLILEHDGPLRTRDDAAGLLDHLQRTTRFGVLGLETDEIMAALDAAGEYGQEALVRTVTRLYFARRDPTAAFWVVKSPRLCYHVRRLLEIYPDLFLVQIVRDGRAVFASKTRSLSYEGPMATNLVHAAAVWRRKLRINAAFAARRVDVRFEDLVRQPEPTLRAVLDALQVPAAERALTKSQADFAAGIADDHRHVHENVERKPLPERVDAWRQHLSPSEVYLYERLNGRWLSSFGYEVGAHAPAAHLRLAAAAGLRYAVSLPAMWGVRLMRPLQEGLRGGSVRQFLRRKRTQLLSRPGARLS